jgi:hypothetical protein
MSRKSLVLALCFALAAPCALGWAQSAVGIKVIPYGVDYPLIRTMYYSPPKRGPLGTSGVDPNELTFGVRRWYLRPIESARDPKATEFRETLDASKDWLDLYGGYGVLGHGEEVFTRQAAAYRATHRGR